MRRKSWRSAYCSSAGRLVEPEDVGLNRHPMKKQQTITSLPPSPDEERLSREWRYAITMGIRGVCFILMFVLPGWWRLAAVLGAVILPYIAVVLANVVRGGVGSTLEQPQSSQLALPPGQHAIDKKAP